jgi:FKBP-type peptidyl-prolyl cis-trans isomerase SlpA
VIPGFENGIVGMAENETKTINIPSNEAYGDKRPELFQEIPMEQLPDNIEYKVGLKLITKTNEGQDLPIVVSEVKKESIVIDANHPLAGEDLVFDVKLVEIA